jgi:hypothetical protein
VYLPYLRKQITSILVRLYYSDINPDLDWLQCANRKLVYEKESINNNQIILVPVDLVNGFYILDISYKTGVNIMDNQTITIGRAKGETNFHINFPQSAYKLI